MPNFIQNFILWFIGLFFLSWLISSPIRWGELSKQYRREQGKKPQTILINQRGRFKSVKGSTSIKGLIIGICDEGLHLSVPFIEIFFPSLLIPWNEITYQKSVSNSYKEEYIFFYFGNPVITSLRLSPKIIKELEEDYGEPIFFNKLGELN